MKRQSIIEPNALICINCSHMIKLRKAAEVKVRKCPKCKGRMAPCTIGVDLGKRERVL